MKQVKKSVIKSAVTLVFLGGGIIYSSEVKAAGFNFSSLEGNTSSPIVLPEAIFTSSSGTFLIDESLSICAVSTSNDLCEEDFEITFNGFVNNLRFAIFGFNPGDKVNISAFDTSNNLINSLLVDSSGGLADFSSLGNISRLSFDDSSTGGGFAYRGFSFDLTPTLKPEKVPEPLSLLGTGVALGIGSFVKRRKGKIS